MPYDLNNAALQSEASERYEDTLTDEERADIEEEIQERIEQLRYEADVERFRVAFNTLYTNVKDDIIGRLIEFEEQTIGNLCREDSDYKDALDAVIGAVIDACKDYPVNEWSRQFQAPFLKRLVIGSVERMLLK